METASAGVSVNHELQVQTHRQPGSAGGYGRCWDCAGDSPSAGRLALARIAHTPSWSMTFHRQPGSAYSPTTIQEDKRGVEGQCDSHS